jgi:alkylhydroperoxidase/carboxymuconolactone decarboxylase family protein YurZ
VVVAVAFWWQGHFELVLAQQHRKNALICTVANAAPTQAMDELLRTGLNKMNEVYAWDMPDMPGKYFALTVDHLFGKIWTRPGLAMRDRRLAVIAVLTAQGQEDLLEVQVNTVAAQRGTNRRRVAGTRHLHHPLSARRLPTTVRRPTRRPTLPKSSQRSQERPARAELPAHACRGWKAGRFG